MKASTVRILLRWIKANSVLLVNAGSLVGTTAVTSVLGFAYWWLAARQFPLEAIGIASASISAMTLLGYLCMLGLGTLLITELPRQPGQAGSLISTALIVVGGVGGCIGILFVLVAPYLSADFRILRVSIADIVIFAVGVSLTAITLVLDQALIGLLRGELQLWRNTLFAVAKLVALFVVGLWLSHASGITIYATWAVGTALSLAAVSAFVVFKKKGLGKSYLPQWGLLRKLGAAALQHHLLNLILLVPTLALPVLVTVLLSATMNAWFYVSWMIASFVFLIPGAVTTVLHAMNSAQPSTLAHKARMTIGLALVTSALANCLLQFGTKQVLDLFGSTYAEQAAWTLRILAIAAFPLIIKNHYISICRIHDRIARAMLGMLPGGLLELGAAALGAHLGGLSGLSIGWVAAIYIESMFMFRTVYKAVFPSEESALSTELQYQEARALWLMDTTSLPAISPGYAGTQALWLMDTTPLPIIGQSYIAAGAPWLINTSLLPIMKLPAIGQVTREPNSNKQSLQNGVNRGNNGSRQRLKPAQLQPYTPHPGRIPKTNSGVNRQFLERIHDNSTIFEDQVK